MNSKGFYTLFTLLALLLAQLLRIGGITMQVQAIPSTERGSVVRFVVTGDSRGEESDADGVNNTILAEIAQVTIEENADFILFTGDLVWGSSDPGTLQSQLEAWRSIMQPVYDAGIGVYPTRGNHEVGSKVAWDNVFTGTYALPQNGPSGEENITFSGTYTNVFIVGLDQYVILHRVNQAWLNDQFASNTQPHVFVFGHEPAFKVRHTDCLDDYPNDRNIFWNSIKDEGGRLYFCGHDHFFDHSRLDDGDDDPNDDLHQYIVGTAGAPLRSDGAYNGNNCPWSPQRIYHEMEYGYVLVEIDGPTATLTWKHRTAPGEYEAIGDVFSYTVTSEPPGGWVAYNDLNPSNSSNAPNVTEYDYTASNAPLKDFHTGVDLPVTITGTIVGDCYDPQPNGGNVTNENSDAHLAFNCPVDLTGLHEIDHANCTYILNFGGLDPNKEYNITLTANRNNINYDGQRYTKVTIEGAETYSNTSSVGVVVNSPASVSFSTGYNAVNGYVARWTGITASPGYTFAIKSEWDASFAGGKGYAMSAFRLEEEGEVNRPPVLDPIGDQSMNEGDVLTVTVSASDPNGDELTLTATGLPTFATFTDYNDGTGSLYLAPDFDDAGSYAATITATDSGALFDEETITITVDNASPSPAPYYYLPIIYKQHM